LQPTEAGSAPCKEFFLAYRNIKQRGHRGGLGMPALKNCPLPISKGGSNTCLISAIGPIGLETLNQDPLVPIAHYAGPKGTVIIRVKTTLLKTTAPGFST